MGNRAGAILAVSDVERSVAFYHDAIGFVEVDDARAEHERLRGLGVEFLADPYEPPWGGCRFFCVDPDSCLATLSRGFGRLLGRSYSIKPRGITARQLFRRDGCSAESPLVA
jgi:hypothetical protein